MTYGHNFMIIISQWTQYKHVPEFELLRGYDPLKHKIKQNKKSKDDWKDME